MHHYESVILSQTHNLAMEIEDGDPTNSNKPGITSHSLISPGKHQNSWKVHISL